MSLERCERCRGTKRVVGMGNIEKKCPECNGVGWIEKKAEVNLIEELSNEISIKKRGRPAKG